MTVRSANAPACRLYLRPPQELAGLRLDELCADGHADSLIGEIASCTDSPRAFTAAQLRGDGTQFRAEVTASRCGGDEDGSVLLLLREQLRELPRRPRAALAAPRRVPRRHDRPHVLG